jgi:hypothetical protein
MISERAINGSIAHEPLIVSASSGMATPPTLLGTFEYPELTGDVERILGYRPSQAPHRGPRLVVSTSLSLRVIEADGTLVAVLARAAADRPHGIMALGLVTAGDETPHILAASRGGMLQSWNGDTLKALPAFRAHADSFHGLYTFMSAGGEPRVATAGREGVKVWACGGGWGTPPLITIAAGEDVVTALSGYATPEGHRLVVGYRGSSTMESVRVHDAETGELLRTMRGHSAPGVVYDCGEDDEGWYPEDGGMDVSRLDCLQAAAEEGGGVRTYIVCFSNREAFKVFDAEDGAVVGQPASFTRGDVAENFIMAVYADKGAEQGQGETLGSAIRIALVQAGIIIQMYDGRRREDVDPEVPAGVGELYNGEISIDAMNNKLVALAAFPTATGAARLVSASCMGDLTLWDPAGNGRGAPCNFGFGHRAPPPTCLQVMEGEGRWLLAVGFRRGAVRVYDLGDMPPTAVDGLRAATKRG